MIAVLISAPLKRNPSALMSFSQPSSHLDKAAAAANQTHPGLSYMLFVSNRLQSLYLVTAPVPAPNPATRGHIPAQAASAAAEPLCELLKI